MAVDFALIGLSSVFVSPLILCHLEAGGGTSDTDTELTEHTAIIP